MPIVVLAILAGVGIFFMGNKVESGIHLPDIEPEDQGGHFSTEYDEALSDGAYSYSIPFALVKAHAIRESALNPGAFRQEPSGKASYGLMQVLWWKGSNRFQKYGFPDDQIGDGSSLYKPSVNVLIACGIIKQNLTDFGNLRDAINAYNTGVRESVRVAPNNYVNDVLKYYSTLVKGSVS